MFEGFRRVGIGLLLLALAASAVEAAPRHVVTRPDWVKKPTGDEMAEFFPKRAYDEEVSGRAIIICDVTVEGLLAGCKVDDEQPRGYGFGAAALSAASFFRMSPKTVDGQPVEGGTVSIPLVFNIPKTEVYPGAMAMILTPLGPKGADPALETMPCPDGQGDCQVHPFEWAAHPSDKDAARILAPVTTEDGTTYAGCTIAADGLLQDCQLIGDVKPTTQAAALAAIKGLKAPPKTEDGLATASSGVMIVFDWEWLKLGPKEYLKRHPQNDQSQAEDR